MGGEACVRWEMMCSPLNTNACRGGYTYLCASGICTCFFLKIIIIIIIILIVLKNAIRFTHLKTIFSTFIFLFIRLCCGLDGIFP